MSSTRLLGIDAGGTFTDFVCVELGGEGGISIHKTPSTPEAPERAIVDGLHAMGLSGAAEGGTLHIIHGSTVATNALLEGRLARTVFVTNYGLGDMLTLARQTRPALYALHTPARPEPVPEALCLETGGRLGADGEVVEALGDEEIARLVQRIKALAPEAVAINLLFSFLDDRFERKLEKALAAADPSLFISRSSAVLPVYQEYERGIATWLNAALGPVVSGYISRLENQLPGVPLQIMQSSGETLQAGRAADAAVNLLLSGPAGGLTAMRFLGSQCAEDRIISFDMGGTSTDVALIDGDVQITRDSSIAGFPVAVPMVDMHTIGAGGGSIATVDAGGLLQVGPRSAGAEPGPACYGKGGSEATVTDANLVLGRLLAGTRFAGGLTLDREPAEAALEPLARQLELSVAETALGIVRIANEHMARALRLISVNRGHDPADFLLASFGGAGGLHVCAIAEAMGMARALVPVHGGVLSALGMLVADQGRQFTRTVNLILHESHGDEIDRGFTDLLQQGRAELAMQGVDAGNAHTALSADLRYRGQSYTLNVAFESVSRARRSFNEQHAGRYGYRLEEDIEVVNLRVNVHSPQQQFGLPAIPDGDCKKSDTTEVYGHAGEVAVYAREALAADKQLPGPAIITEYAATTFVAPGWHFTLDKVGNLRLYRSNVSGPG